MDTRGTLTADFGFGPYKVTEIPHFVHKLKDGTEIAMKLWLPWSLSKKNLLQPAHDVDLAYKGTETFPTILEYIPYRKSDWTASRDHNRHNWFSSHGYVCARPDMRGSGDSSGYYFDEYEKQEQHDCIEIIEWLSSQQWSNSRVAMFGKSWGGFNGLQVAYHVPAALKTVISLYSTDNRFTDDVHYIGGCVMGSGLLSWSSQMLLWNARPMTPKFYSSEKFLQLWKNRLEKSTECWAKKWLQHQRYDDYWKHGSICEDFSRIQCPILIIGGLRDSYTNAAFRMASLLNEKCKTVIGPWDHAWPDVSASKPNIDFLGLCLDWFDFHLKDKIALNQSNVERWPALQVYVRNGYPPQSDFLTFEGNWFEIPNWRKLYQNFASDICIDSDENCSTQTFSLNDRNELNSLPVEPDQATVDLPKPHLFQGLHSGDWISWDGYSMPLCQSTANTLSLCFTSEYLTNPLTICGFTKIKVAVEAIEQGRYSLAARLCHVWPNGQSTLITYGLVNIGALDNDGCGQLKANEKKLVTFCLDATTYNVPAGHKLCLSFSTSLFPILYPLSKAAGTLKLHLNSCLVTFQTLPEKTAKIFNSFFKPPRLLFPFPTEHVEKSKTERKVEFQLDSDSVVVTKTVDSGRQFYPTLQLEYAEKSVELYETNFDVDHCTISISNTAEMKYSDDTCTQVKIETESKMSSNDEKFILSNRVETTLNGKEFFKKLWTDEINRQYV